MGREKNGGGMEREMKRKMGGEREEIEGKEKEMEESMTEYSSIH